MTYKKFNVNDYRSIEGIVGKDDISSTEPDLLTNAIDAFPGEWFKPDVVIWPENVSEISQVLRYANERKIPVSPRGGGTGLAGNVVPVQGGIILNLRKMNRILGLKLEDQQVEIEPGVVCDRLNEELSKYNLFFPPDPSSSSACTIGGMIGNNASGLKAVKYGVTKDYVLRLEIVLPNGEIIEAGSNTVKSSIGYNLVDLFVGSEGTLGIVTRITLRVKVLPKSFKTATAYFKSTIESTQAVTAIISSGLNPSALEFLDEKTIAVVNEAEHLGLGKMKAMLIIEFDGGTTSTSEDLTKALDICKRNNAVETHIAENENKRMKLWAARKAAYPALLRLAPATMIGDVVVPISKISEMVEFAYTTAKKYKVPIASFGHCGDGNVHPVLLADRSEKDLWDRATKANREIVIHAIELGGGASGEHGIGLEKKEFMDKQHGKSIFLMKEIKNLIDPNNIMNPGKFF